MGFIQGRLSPICDGKIQAFPWQYWEDEFQIAYDNEFSIMEWTLDQDRLYDNPIINVSEERRYDHIIPSVDDMLMEEGVPEQKEDDGIRAPILRRLPSNGENAAGKKKRRRKTKRRRKRRRRKTRNIKG